MLKEELEAQIRKAVGEYILDEETYDDNAQLCINPSTMEVFVEDSRNVDVDSPEIDCYDVMDFVKMIADPEHAGKWIVDEEAVNSVAGEYAEA
ncbi:MAG: hypothetical protein K2H76_09825 [Muribaculaceae bacterium]|nr:hypothetical protein [Muribaculaceae bacterium]MDE6027813.1 hypothetical protein [Muribaculaceae bacterium]